MEDEITEKDDRIAQLEQQVIYNRIAQLEQLFTTTHNYPDHPLSLQLGALEGKLKHEEDMSHFYTVELNKAQKVHNGSVCCLIDVCVCSDREGNGG